MNRHKVLFYTCGNANDMATWSNVPFLFAKALEKKGFILHRVDISPSKIINRIFNTASFYLFKKLFHLRSCPEFHRTWLHRAIIYRRLKKANKMYPESELNLFLSFAFINKYSPKPNVLWCDWTDRVVIERLGRAPKWYEKRSLAHEDGVMKRADAVYTMFPKCKEHLEDLYQIPINYLNRNVINTVYEGDFDLESTTLTRKQSNKILFIGNLRYKSGAVMLIQAVNEMRQKMPDLEVHVIGMKENELGQYKNVFCHGYLHKDNEKERNLYYELLLNCRCLVNPTKGWAGYSSCVEAMYYGCPIIISPYEDFTAEFGKDISFGYYCDEYNLKDKIEQLFCCPDYPSMCESAHIAVKDYTWDNYMDAFIQSLQDKGLLK